jgi:hypothetical protein
MARGLAWALNRFGLNSQIASDTSADQSSQPDAGILFTTLLPSGFGSTANSLLSALGWSVGLPQKGLGLLQSVTPTITWNVDVGGDWSNTADWNPARLPGSLDDVLINTQHLAVITYDGNTLGSGTIHSLTVENDGLLISGGSLTISNGASFLREFTVNGATLATGGTTTLPDLGVGGTSNWAAIVENGALWQNSGTVNDAGVIIFENGASTIDNGAGAVFNLTTNDSNINKYGATAGTFTNEGTLEKTGGAGTSTIAIALANTGTVSVSSGTLDFRGGGSLGGTFSTSGTGLIELGGGTFTAQSQTVSLDCNIQVSGGTLQPGTGNTITLSGTVTFGMSNASAYILGPGTLVTSGMTTVSDLGVGGPSNWAAQIESGGLWQNKGTVNDAGVIIFEKGTSTIDNAAGAIFNLTTNDGNINAYGGSAGTFINEGTLEKTGGTGTSIIGMALTNTGTVSVSSGTLDFRAGGLLGGIFRTPGTGLIELSAGTFKAQAQTASLGGNIQLSGGTLEPGTGNTITLSGRDTFGIINASAYIFGPGTLVTSGTTKVTDLGVGGSSNWAAQIENGALWRNEGAVKDAGVIAFEGSASTIDNAAGAIFNLTTDDGNIGAGGSGTFTNEGTLEKTGGTGTSTITIALANTGTVGVSSGTLDFRDGGLLGGTFRTSGTGIIELGAGTFTTHAQTLSLGANIQISGGTLQPGTGNTITLSGMATLGISNAAAYLGHGTLVTSGTTTVTDLGVGNAAAQVESAALWQNKGTVNDAGVIVLASGVSTIDNAAGAIFNLTTDDGSIGTNGGSGRLTNEGTLEKTGGTGTSTFAIALTNTGTVTVSSGTLDFTGGGLLGGTFKTSGTGVIELGDGTFAAQAQTASLGGNIQVFGATLQPGSGKTITLSGTDTFGISNASAHIWGPGTLVTSGITAVTDLGKLSNNPSNWAALVGNGVLWQNEGTINDAGVIVFENGVSTINNVAGAIFNLTTDDGNISGTGKFTNEGTLEKTGGTAMSLIASALTNTGTVRVSSGTLEFTGGVTNLSGTTISGGIFEADAGAKLLLGNASIVTDDATLILNGTGSEIQYISTTLTKIAASGTLEVLGDRGYTTSNAIANSGTLQLGGGTFTAASLSDSAGSMLTGFGTVAAAFTNAGTVLVTSGTLEFTGGGTSVASGISVGSGATLEIAGGTFNLTGGTSTGTGTILVNSGALNVTGAATFDEALTIASGATVNIGAGTTISEVFTNNGTVAVQSGVLHIDAAMTGTGAVTVDAGASFVLNAASSNIANSIIVESASGTVSLAGGSGNDVFQFDSGFSALDSVNGGGGSNTLILDGDYASGVTFGAGTMTNIQALVLDGAFNYNLTLNATSDPNGAALTVNAAGVGAGNSVRVDGSAENGTLTFELGKGSDTLIGGTGSNRFDFSTGLANITAGSGKNTFALGSAADSTSTNYDTINNYNASNDVFQLKFAIAGINTAITSGTLSTASFNHDLAAAVNSSTLGAHDAVLFTPNSGTLAGQTFLVIDANGVAGYQPGHDFVIDLGTTAHLTGFGLHNFIT